MLEWSRPERNALRRIASGCALASVLCAGVVGLLTVHPSAQTPPRRGPQGYIGGVVKSSKGPEAGVWVIAQTNELQTKFAKIVVTADDGRFMLPEMPTAQYDVWVRGYGLIDSKPVKAKVGDTLALNVDLAKTPAEAAKVYP